jgi:hypothetical protein
MDSHTQPHTNDEPRTPTWLTSLGIVLFILFASWVAIQQRPAPTEGGAAGEKAQAH